MLFGEEPRKQKPRSCRAQELARSRAQGKAWQKKSKCRGSAKSARGEKLASEQSIFLTVGNWKENLPAV